MDAQNRDAVDAIRTRLIEQIAQATSAAISELRHLGAADDVLGVVEAGIEASIRATRRQLGEIRKSIR
jgi:hypothetical protein